MKIFSVLILFLLQMGCAYFPPKPAECKGSFKPINTSFEHDDKATDGKASTEIKANKVVLCNKGAING
ncbi:hypothetical protein [Methylotenera sp. G11]|uniref:hypothetical protein n=1 Tax=Methylotenera sp. G11 TaxID=1506585 RepID=UPI000646EBDF|nr:hypothetical protein [Methylotenera sp. G11]